MYSVELKGEARKQYRVLQPKIRAKADAIIAELKVDPLGSDSIALKGRHVGFRRIRIDYRHRIVYTVDDDSRTITVSYIGPRESAPYA